MREIAIGLKALHNEGIILRELRPTTILLREGTGTVLLTDFELAKLSDGRPTVSRDRWPRNPYRANEVGAPTIDTTVDLYSWGRILVRAVCGKPLPPMNFRLPRPARRVPPDAYESYAFTKTKFVVCCIDRRRSGPDHEGKPRSKVIISSSPR